MGSSKTSDPNMSRTFIILALAMVALAAAGTYTSTQTYFSDNKCATAMTKAQCDASLTCKAFGTACAAKTDAKTGKCTQDGGKFTTTITGAYTTASCKAAIDAANKVLPSGKCNAVGTTGLSYAYKCTGSGAASVTMS